MGHPLRSTPDGIFSIMWCCLSLTWSETVCCFISSLDVRTLLFGRKKNEEEKSCCCFCLFFLLLSTGSQHVKLSRRLFHLSQTSPSFCWVPLLLALTQKIVQRSPVLILMIMGWSLSIRATLTSQSVWEPVYAEEGRRHIVKKNNIAALFAFPPAFK